MPSLVICHFYSLVWKINLLLSKAVINDCLYLERTHRNLFKNFYVQISTFPKVKSKLFFSEAVVSVAEEQEQEYQDEEQDFTVVSQKVKTSSVCHFHYLLYDWYSTIVFCNAKVGYKKTNFYEFSTIIFYKYCLGMAE